MNDNRTKIIAASLGLAVLLSAVAFGVFCMGSVMLSDSSVAGQSGGHAISPSVYADPEIQAFRINEPSVYADPQILSWRVLSPE